MPSTKRLADAIDSAAGSTTHGVLAISLSMGLDGTDPSDPHGLLMFGLATHGGQQGVYPNDVFKEPALDCRADTYGVRHTDLGGEPPTDDDRLTIKVREENDDEQPTGSHQYLPTLTLGIAGGATGSPHSQNPPDVIGSDYHLPSHNGSIYFTVDRPIPGTSFGPGQILELDGSNTISIWATRNELNLTANDKINSLSACLVQHEHLGVPKNALFSLAPGSPGLASHGVESADILFYKQGNNGFTVWRDRDSLGLVFGAVVVIDEIESIDPKRFVNSGPWGRGSIHAEIVGHPGPYSIECLSALAGSVIEWDFELGPLDGNNFFSPARAIQAGDKGKISVHYLDQDGIPRSHHQVLEVPRDFDNPATKIMVQSLTSTEMVLEFGAGLGAGIANWDVIVNGVEQNLGITGPVDEVTIPRPAAGVCTIAVHAENALGRSNGVYLNYTIPSTTETPTDLEIVKVDEDSYEIHWAVQSGHTSELTLRGSAAQQIISNAVSPYVVSEPDRPILPR